MSDETPADSELNQELPRSPERMHPLDTGLLVVDAQQRMLEVMPDNRRIVWNIGRLLDAAKLLDVSRAATAQNPAKLGPVVAELAERLPPPPAKQAFSCGACGEIFAAWSRAGRHRVLLCGIETHVCILQTALDLMADGFRVYLAVDAVTARHRVDHETALRRLESSGATLTTVETVLFEWCQTAAAPKFKQISSLVKETGP